MEILLKRGDKMFKLKKYLYRIFLLEYRRSKKTFAVSVGFHFDNFIIFGGKY